MSFICTYGQQLYQTDSIMQHAASSRSQMPSLESFYESFRIYQESKQNQLMINVSTNNQGSCLAQEVHTLYHPISTITLSSMLRHLDRSDTSRAYYFGKEAIPADHGGPRNSMSPYQQPWPLPFSPPALFVADMPSSINSYLRNGDTQFRPSSSQQPVYHPISYNAPAFTSVSAPHGAIPALESLESSCGNCADTTSAAAATAAAAGWDPANVWIAGGAACAAAAAAQRFDIAYVRRLHRRHQATDRRRARADADADADADTAPADARGAKRARAARPTAR
jgi:hypothetical protein